MRYNWGRPIKRRGEIVAIYSGRIITVGLGVYRRWCSLPYYNHPKGCPMQESCNRSFSKMHIYDDVFNRQAISWCIWESFDLGAHAKKMKMLHSEWSSRMCRNLLYWQGGVRKRRQDKVKEFFRRKNLWGKYACVTKGFGINTYATMKKAGIILEPIKDIQMVRSICFICEYKEQGIVQEQAKIGKQLIVY